MVWRLVQDHVNPQLLFVGTEFGVFFSPNGGERWVELQGGVPNIPFRDLAIQRRENDLVGATFGRGFFVLDDYTPLRDVDDATLEREAVLFPPRKAWWYVERTPLGSSPKASQGDAFFQAPNPPFGAVFTYYLRDELTTAKERRRELEQARAEEGGDNPYPGWDELRREAREEEPSVLLTVRDRNGDVVRRLTGPVGAGFHRVAWDLRYPSPKAWTGEEPDKFDGVWNRGLLAEPGTYRVQLAKRENGVVTEFGEEQSFEVVRLREGTLAGVTPRELAEQTRALDALRRDLAAARSAVDETKERLGAIRETLLRAAVGATEFDDEVRALERQLQDLELVIFGERRRSRANDPGPVSIERRLSVAVMGTLFSTYGLTTANRESFEIAREEFTSVRADLDRLLQVDLPAFEAELDEAGVPWTPGRGVSRVR